jgi:hypothetical protein
MHNSNSLLSSLLHVYMLISKCAYNFYFLLFQCIKLMLFIATEINRLHLLELATGAFLFFCGCYDLAFGHNHYFIYLFLQAFAFFTVGIGYVGTIVPHT